MTRVVDGPALRTLRESLRIPIRWIARQAGMSHGHLLKVERSEFGRPVTPAILAAYERATGVNVTDAVATGQLPPRQAARAEWGGGWWPGQMSDAKRRDFRALVATFAVGGPTRPTPGTLYQSAGSVDLPDDLAADQVDSLEQVADLLDETEGLSGTVAHALLAWALRLPADGEHGARLSAVVARLARRAAASARVVNRHDAARHLYLLGLQAATSADHPDLRAGVLADLADQNLDLGYPDEAVAVLRIADGDERVSGETHAVVKALRARAEQEQVKP